MLSGCVGGATLPRSKMKFLAFTSHGGGINDQSADFPLFNNLHFSSHDKNEASRIIRGLTLCEILLRIRLV
jgi:hypothetical protein